jgi:hypothetical protein
MNVLIVNMWKQAVREDQAELRYLLSHPGSVHHKTPNTGGSFVDITETAIASCQRRIAELEPLIASYS